MMKKKPKLTLVQPATYEIKVPGILDASWSEWDARMTISVEHDADGLPVTTLDGTVDQAGLQSLLRRIYSMGVPLISVKYVASG